MKESHPEIKFGREGRIIFNQAMLQSIKEQKAKLAIEMDGLIVQTRDLMRDTARQKK